ncbi:MAG: tetratricopeptide repeat protein [Candidatus Aegiribacteria sp.]|nr:tetratricopeptide repeat protein [Candidatus Aegiribacteria sp.]
MGKKPKAEETEHTIDELITGIGKLVYKLNESVVNIDNRIEKLEAGISSLLEQKFESVTAELVKTNEFLAGISKSAPIVSTDTKETEKPVSGESADVPANGLIEKLDELKAEVTGIRENLTSAEDKFLKALNEGPEESVDKEFFKKEFSEVSLMISESASSIQKTVLDVIGQSDESREEVLAVNLKVLSDGIGEISSKMDKASDNLQKKLKKIQTSTAEEVGAIGSSVKESTDAQKEQLQQMKELLTLHSVEVKDNRVKSLNRSAIVHFNNAEYDQALSKLKEALEISPDSSELLANMAHIEASQGQLKDAEESFRKALDINPDLEPAISGLGTVLVMTGRSDETIDFLQKYLDEDSDASTDIMIALSRAYAAQDNHVKALALLEKAVKAAPGHPGLEQELAKYKD